MSRRSVGSRLAVVLVVCALVAAPGVVLADADGQPRLGASLVENRVVAGEETTLQVTLTNAGELDQASTTNPALNQRVLTATGVSVHLRDGGAPLAVTTARQRIGSLPDGGERVVPFTVSVDEDATPGTYRLPVDVEYSFTSSISEPNGFVTDETLRDTLFVTVRVVEQARFAVVGVDADVGPASVGTVSLTVENVGNEAADNTAVALESLDSAVTVGAGSASRFAGDWAPGERRTLTYVVTAADTTVSDEYPFRVTAAFDDARGVPRTAAAGVVGIAPSIDRRFVVTGVESDVAAGGAGTVTVTLRNDGPATEEATVALQSQSGALAVDGAQASSRFLGDWATGTERTVSFGVTALPGTEGGTYALDAAVSYRGAAGVTAAARPASVGVAVAGTPAFSLADVEVSLAVGEQGTIRGTVVNDGATPVRNAVVVLSSPSANVQPLESTYAVGDIAPGASAAFAAAAVVSPTAEAGPRPVDVTVRYTDASGTTRQSDPLQLAAAVAEQPDRLAFEAVNATYGSDTDNRLEVRVTNVGDERLDDVQVRLAAGPPFTSESPTAFVASLAPGETATVGFELTVSEDAVESTHAVALNATAETADGTTVRTVPELVPVTVAEPEGPGGDLALVGGGAVLVVVVLVAGWWWLRR
ncbi:COG1361 S-layer family protein [Halorarius litoreus]|uniref:COG1361 S-layer family protein n=1 Tax=Halorarius litoreus TaxID=2962676 RepID=UPI0020CD53F4|nr:NEW3 domain-containing protein [Halorarius litoreus]